MAALPFAVHPFVAPRNDSFHGIDALNPAGDPGHCHMPTGTKVSVPRASLKSWNWSSGGEASNKMDLEGGDSRPHQSASERRDGMLTQGPAIRFRRQTCQGTQHRHCGMAHCERSADHALFVGLMPVGVGEAKRRRKKVHGVDAARALRGFVGTPVTTCHPSCVDRGNDNLTAGDGAALSAQRRLRRALKCVPRRRSPNNARLIRSRSDAQPTAAATRWTRYYARILR
jgi:hypothetical protein